MRCVYHPVNCPFVIFLPRIEVLLSFGRDTSLVNITGPRSILSSLFTSLFPFQYLLSVAIIIIILCFLSFVPNKTGEIDNLSKLRWEQSYLGCVQVQVKEATSVVNG